jgi:hypothetical protein
MADLILILHSAWVLWMLWGLALTLHGLFRPGRFMDRWLARSLHLAGLLLVAGFPLLGRLCPLTVWEQQWRGGGGEEGFLQRFFQAFLYWELPLWVFGAAYGLAALFTLAVFILRPPARFGKRG